MYISKYKKRVAVLIMAFLIFVGVFSVQAFATEQSAQNSIALEVRLKFDGSTPAEDVRFTFVLDADDGAPVPNSSYTYVYGSGKGKFDEITYTTPGEYHYTIYQRNDGVAYCTYDSTVYDVYVNVKNDNGQLVATCSAYSQIKRDVKQPELLFVNKYDEPDSPGIFIETDPSAIQEVPESTEMTNPYVTSNTFEATNPTDESETTVPNSSTEIAESTSPLVGSTTNISTGKSNPTDTPKTSDDTNTLPWIVILCVAIIGLISLNVVKFYRKNQDDHKNGQ
jgi:pilin isopeptide linkage protein